MKTICIYHSRDLDGWMSAAIVKKWFNETYPKANSISDLNKDTHAILPPDEVGTGESLYMLGWDYGDDIPNLEKYDRVIMCDISFPPENMEAIATDFLGPDADQDFIWIDHHISAIKANEDIEWVNGLRDTKFAACELTWMYFYTSFSSSDVWEGMPEIVRLLGRYDCFGHKGTDEEQKVLEFQYGARQEILNYDHAYYFLDRDINAEYYYGDKNRIIKDILSKGKTIYDWLCSEAQQIYKKAFTLTFLSPKKEAPQFGYKYNFLCVNQERFNPINFGIDYHKEGYDGFTCFWFNNGMWNFSLYNDNGEVDCSQIAKQYGGGGHKGAAGFIINDINKIIN